MFFFLNSRIASPISPDEIFGLNTVTDLVLEVSAGQIFMTNSSFLYIHANSISIIYGSG
jgi:hypothetical protein